MAYYLKYRPQSIEDLDIESVRSSLQQILSAKELPHAFLLVGPKGTGKTSSARILAKILNCSKRKEGSTEPCNKCENCLSIAKGNNLDLIEIDAASNRGIDDIRDLKDKINLAPSNLTMKIYIIDEVHMLTNEAFNALLKTLEEPPKHASFMLCTTELAKVPATIVSRCVQVNFTKASTSELTRSLTRVVKGEGLKIDDEALKLIAASADGSFRDAVKVLEMFSGDKAKITAEKVESVLNSGLSGKLDDWLMNLYQKDFTKAFAWLKTEEAAGKDMRNLSNLAVERLRQIWLAKLGVDADKGKDGFVDNGTLMALLKKMHLAAREVKTAVIDILPLEIMVAEWCEGEEQTEIEAVAVGTELEVPVQSNIKKVAGKISLDLVKQKWEEILKAMRPHNHSLEALLRGTRPAGFTNGALVLEVFYKFHKERLEVDKYRLLVEEVTSQILGDKLAIKYLLREEKKKADDDMIKMAEEVFGA